MRVRELATWLGVTFEGDGETELTAVAPIDSAGSTDLSFVASRKGAKEADVSMAGCLIVPQDFENRTHRTVMRSAAPRTDFARAVAAFHPAQPVPAGIHPTAAIAYDVEIGEGVMVGAHATIGSGSRIGASCQIHSGCSIGQRVVIGTGSILRSNVTIYDDVEIGASVILHAGCVIGADGFGFVMDRGRYQKFPQIGRVIIGDSVEIGANSCVDRAALGVTWIGEGAKIDNMVHVGHNCRIGKHVVVAAQTGFSGGVVVGDYAVVGGQVGIGDKARIESRAVLGSGCGILTSKIVRAGEVVWGTPARPLKQYLEQLANLARLPDLRREVTQMKERLARLEKPSGERRA